MPIGEIMEKSSLKSVYFKKLKGLTDIEIVFEKPLTAIMGVNGAGKTTVIHALACLYKPDGKGENHKFPEFFIPNTDSRWMGSELKATFATEKGEVSRVYGKNLDRWKPRYEDRPKRNVYYIGIDTCLPEIEKETSTSQVTYNSETLDDKESKRIIEEAAYILNKDYSSLIDNTYKKKHFFGVSLVSGLKYSSLSMGTGEQRTLKILKKVTDAEPYSLILIDEIDLLLHVSALHRLIKTLSEEAKKKHLQIVFTTHSLEMSKMTQDVDIRYIKEIPSEGRFVVYNKITNDLIYDLTESSEKKYNIYVEDSFAKEIVLALVRKNNMSALVNVVTFGSIENGFILAASHVLENKNLNNEIVVFDGDKYSSEESKLDRLKKTLTGTEDDIGFKREKACEIIMQFNLPTDASPEKFAHTLILNNVEHDSELYKAACEIRTVRDSHEWIYNICQKTSRSESDIIREMVDASYNDAQFKAYVKPINDWLIERKET